MTGNVKCVIHANDTINPNFKGANSTPLEMKQTLRKR